MITYSGVKTAVETYVVALVGKVFPLVAPEAQSLPYCTYQQIFESNTQLLSGYEGERFVDYQINFYAVTYATVKLQADLFKEGVKNFSGDFGDARVQCVELLNTHESAEDVASKMRYIVMVDVRFYCVLKI